MFGLKFRMRYINFDLSIEQHGEKYLVRASNPSLRIAKAEEEFQIPFDIPELERIYDTVEIAVLRSVGRVARRIGDPGTERLRIFGRTLFNTVFTGKIQEAYAASLANANRKEKGLRIRLSVHANLSQLPWEFLNDDFLVGDFLLLSRWTPIIRFIQLPRPPRTLRVKLPLKILVVFASPKGTPALEVVKEFSLIRQSLYRLVELDLVEIDVVTGPNTLDKLRRQLAKKNYHVLHIVCHGDYDAHHQEGILLFEDVSGSEQTVGAEQISRLVRNSPSIRLAILNSCKGTVQSSGHGFTSLAHSLVQIGIPAVVAMQFEIKDEDGVIFASSFYEAIALNMPVDAAVSEARLNMALQNPDSIAWATPVLFMRSQTGHLFNIMNELPENDMYVNQIAPTIRDEMQVTEADEEADVEEASPSISVSLSFEEWLQKFHLIHIPAGKFLMGGEGPLTRPDELPLHEIDLEEYWISQFLITNEQYAEFILANPSYHVPTASSNWEVAQPLSWDVQTRTYPPGRRDHPVALVNWYDAMAYCLWLQKISGLRFRLPTEAEWEKAAKGPKHTIYPWGNDWNQKLCNVGYSVGNTTPVGLYSPEGDSGYGIADMAGNLWEWCSSKYRPYPYDASDGREDLEGTDHRVLRGGSWVYSREDARCATRNSLHDPGEIGIDGGLRIVLFVK